MKLNLTDMSARMNPLPRHDRIAHLRALIRRQPDGSVRRLELALQLRGELAAQAACEGRRA